MRSRTRDIGYRAYHGVYRGTVVKADDSQKMQELQITGTFGENIKGVEHWHPYGFSMVPVAPDKEGREAAEVIVANVGSSRDHPVVIGTADRRHRPKDLKPGEVALHDDQKQFIKHEREQSIHQSPKKTVTQLVDSDGAAKSTITQQSDKTTIVRGKTTVTIDDTGGKTTVDVDGTKFVVRKDRIDLGAENAPFKVSTEGGLSQKVFAVL